jgi:hypothetical protein
MNRKRSNVKRFVAVGEASYCFSLTIETLHSRQYVLLTDDKSCAAKTDIKAPSSTEIFPDAA